MPSAFLRLISFAPQRGRGLSTRRPSYLVFIMGIVAGLASVPSCGAMKRLGNLMSFIHFFNHLSGSYGSLSRRKAWARKSAWPSLLLLRVASLQEALVRPPER
jgi:hypothetical protein